MKNLLLAIATTALLLQGCGSHSAVIELNSWAYEYEGQWHSATVPSCIHTDLMAAGIIADPFYGTNEDSVQWVGERAWCYRTLLQRDMWRGYEHCDLLLDGVTLCHVVLRSLQGTADTLSTCNNMFRQWRIALYEPLQQLGDSCWLELHFAPIAQANEAYFSSADSVIELPDYRAATRMAPYMLGWDWGPRLSTVGITVGSRLECYNGTPSEPKVATAESWHIELRQEADSIGQSFTFYKEGKPLFVKGANWIPCHSFPIMSDAMKARYRMLLTAAKEANINMLRVWGGGIYEPDYFYHLCDSLQIMVWQDFNFSCTLYPSHKAFLDNVRQEAEQQVRRIAKHPCVVVWCGNNEVQNGWHDWGWQQQYGWSEAQQAALQQGIDTLFGQQGILAHAVATHDPQQRPYITTSPLYGWGHPECVTHGDSHYWGVWWGEQPFEMYAEKTGRFMSEYGFQSYPDYSTVCRYCPKEQRHIGSPTMATHQKHGRGLAIIDKAMRQYYGVDSRSLTLEDFCYVSQLLQAWGVGYGIYQHIAQQPHCMGTLYWQLNDCWPVASWSSVDYYGNWKALHYRVRDLYADTVNLSHYAQYYATYPKELHLAKADYSLRQQVVDGMLTVTIDAQSDLRDVMLQTEPHIDGHFSNNYFNLAAGNSLTVRFIPQQPLSQGMPISNVKVTLKCLNDILAGRE